MARRVRGLNQYGELEFDDDDATPRMPPPPPVAGGGAVLPVGRVVTWRDQAASAVGIAAGLGLLLYAIATLAH